jgi:hypothetical protein
MSTLQFASTFVNILVYLGEALATQLWVEIHLDVEVLVFLLNLFQSTTKEFHFLLVYIDFSLHQLQTPFRALVFEL